MSIFKRDRGRDASRQPDLPSNPKPPRPGGTGAPTGGAPKREPGREDKVGAPGSTAQPAPARDVRPGGSYIPGEGKKAETTNNPGGKNAASWNINNMYPGIGAGRADFSNNEPGRTGINAI